MKKIILSLIIFSLLAGVIFAQGAELPNPGLTPDSPFYFFDTLGEKIAMFFTFGVEKKAEKALKIAEEKLAEVKVMAEKDKTEALEKANRKYEEFLNLANQKAREAKKKGKDVDQLVTLISEKALKHQEVLSEVYERVPKEAKSAIEKAIEVSKKGFEEAIEAVSGAKKEELERKAEKKLVPEKEKAPLEEIPEKKEEILSPEKEVPPEIEEVPAKIEEKPEIKKEEPEVKDILIISDDLWFDGEIVKVKDNLYRMYFEKKGTIYSAISSDGINWKQEEGKRIDGMMPTLIELSDGRIRIYYQERVEGKEVFLSAVSEDGLNFQKESGIRLSAGDPLDSQGIKRPNIVKLPGGGYRLYYDGESPAPEDPSGFKWMILSAYSKDGLNFQKEEGLRINPKSIGFTTRLWSPYVFYENGSYFMYFTAALYLPKSGVYLAISKDGLNFGTPRLVVGRDPSLGDKFIKNEFGGILGVPEDPFILKTNGKKFLYYWIGGKGIFLKELVLIP